jgi:hypothetical protein
MSVLQCATRSHLARRRCKRLRIRFSKAAPFLRFLSSGERVLSLPLFFKK